MRYKISIIIPVWNEPEEVNRTIDHIFSMQAGLEVEVIVVDGSPGGDTISAIKRKEVRKFISEKGRAKQMNAGASHAEGEVLLFLHADTLLPPEGLKSVVSVLERPEFIGGAFDLRIGSDRLIYRVIETAASFRSRVTRVPYGDQAIFLRKDYFFRVSGFKEIDIMEDVELMRRIKKSGDRICILRSRAETSPRRWEKEGIIYCTLRNWALIGLYLSGVPAKKLSGLYK